MNLTKTNVIIAILLFAALFSQKLSAQTDTEFWLAIPATTTQHGDMGGRIKHIVVSTMGNPATVTVSIPRNLGFQPIVVDVPAYTTERIDLFEYYDLIENHLPDVVEDKGILVESTDNITAYLEQVETQNPDIFALKGRHALGTEFYVPMQNKLPNQLYTDVARSSFDIVATEDNTVVTIVPTAPISKADGTFYPAGSTITVTLQRGQTYSARADSETAVGHPAGSHITSTKPIAVTVKDDSVIAGGWDLIGDQLVPVPYTGSQYIVMKGQLNHPNETINKEFTYLVITENATQIRVNGTVLGTYNQGDVVPVGITATDPFVVIESNNYQKFYAFHISGNGGEIAGAILPPTDQCSGNSRVGFSYSYGDPGQSLYINIMVQVAAINGFKVDGATAAWLNPASFVTTAGGIWAVARFGPLSATDLAEGAHEITNSLGLFHMGYINYTGPGALYGYFSDFATQEIKAVVIQTNEPIATQCVGEDVRLRVDGGFSFSWTGIRVGQPAYNVMTHFNKTNVYNPVLTNLPAGQYQFTVTVGGACGEPPVNKVIDLTIIQGPTPKTVTQNFCESEIGSGCLTGLNLNNFTNQMTGSWPNTTVIKWEKDSYNEMLLYEDYESERHISYTGGYINNLNLAQTNPDITGINTSPVVSSMSTRLSGSNVNFIKISPRGGYAFDMSKGDVFTLMAYNHVYNSWAQDGPRAITMRLINGADSIDVVANFTKYDKWEQLTFDFTSFNKNIIYTEMKLIFDVHSIHEQDVFYLDNLKKLVDHQIVVIPDPSSATVCNGATIYATQENDIGCRSNSTLTPNITAGSFAVNNPTIALCENGAIAGQATGVNFNNYTSNVTGGVAGLTVIKWEKTYVNYDSIYENFDNVKDKILFSTVTTPDQSNTAVLNELYANPKIDAVNGSATCGFITNLGTNSYYQLSIDLQIPIDLSKGNIFNLMAAYRVLSNNNTNAKTVVMELSGGGNPTRVATAVNIYQAGLGNNVWSNWTDIAFNFSAYATEKGFDRITFKFTPNNWQQVQFVIDNLRRTMTPFIAKAPVTNNTVKNGDVVWATVQDANGCKVKSTVTFSVGPGFPINNPTISVCPNSSIVGEATGINYNDYFTNIVPAPTTNKTIVKWEFTKTNYDSIYENFDNVKDYLTFNTVTTPDQGNTTTLNETYVNPVTTGVNTSATCGFITNLSTSNYYQLSIDLLTPIDLSKGSVFKLMAAYRELANFNTNAKTVVMELSGGGNTTRVSTAVNIYQAALGNNVWSNWVDATFDFSAYATESGFNKITFKFAPNNWQQVQFIVDNFRRTMTPFLTSTASVTNKTVKDGDVIYATVQDNNGCIVKSALTFDVLSSCLPPAIDSTVALCEASIGSGNVTGINLTNYNNGIKNNIVANTVTWYSNAILTTLVATPTNVTVTNNLKFYALVRDIAQSKQDTAVLTFFIKSLPNIVFPTINAVCEGSSAFTITGTTPAGGTWSGGAYVNSGGVFTPTLGSVGANTVTYSSTVNGCSSTKNTTVTIKPLPNATLISPLSQTYCGTTGVSIQVSNVTGATYSWKKDGGAIAGGNPLTNALTGTYEVTVTLNSCVQIIPNIQVVGKPLPTYSFSANATICEGATLPTPTVSLTGTGPWNITYTINGTPTSTPVAASPFTIPFSSTAPNTYSIALSAISDANCTGVISAAEAVITINAKPTITFNALPTRCADGTAITLTTYATPAGGTFSGSGVTGSTFTPSSSLIGTNTITYTATNLGCTNTATQNIEVYSLPLVAPISTTDLDVCLNETITLNGNPTVGSGTYITHLWSGQTTPLSATNIANPTFTPTASGNFVMTYRVTDSHTCSAQGNITVVAHALPVMNTNAIGPFCDNAAITDIAVNGTPSGGTWSGTGVTGSNFNPSGLATSSPVTLTYAYTDTYNCSNSTTRQVTINPIPTIAFTLPAQICEYATPITLSATVTPIGGTGTWSGTGVTGNQFNPTGLSGSIVITYSYSINGCSNTLTKNITVNPRPTLTFTLPTQLCSYDATFALDVTPSGGVFTTTYPLTGSSLNPSLATFGQNYSIQYNYQNPTTLCDNSITKNTIVYYTAPPITINNGDVIQNVTASVIPSLSATGTNLNWYYPTLSTQVATGVSSYNPLSSVVVDSGTGFGKIGDYNYLVTQTINGCVSQPAIATLSLVNCPAPKPVVVNADACVDDIVAKKTLSATAILNVGDEIRWCTSPTVYSTGASFVSPENTPGDYTYKVVVYDAANSCEGPSETASIHIYTPPTLTIIAASEVCENGANVSLQGNPSGGVFSGTGVSADEFIPSSLLAQDYTITYEVLYGNNCTITTTKDITVNESPIVTIQDIGPFCSYEIPQTLQVITTPTGGTGVFTSSTGVDISSGIFNPQLFVAGDVTITYDYETTDGCIGSDNSIITINAQPNASFSNPGGYCADVTTVDVSSFVLPAGGVFTGVGITGNNFNPSIAAIGNNSITYIYTDVNTCKDTVTNTVIVNALPTITFNPQSDICIDDIALPLTVTSNKTIVTTTFTGTGVSNPSNWIFTPSVAPQVASTPYTIQVEIEDNQGCKATTSGIITVHYTSPPTVIDAFEITQNVTSATIPVISSVGTDVVIYSDNTLVNQIGTGLSFTAPSSEVIDGVTLKGKAGVYTYYFTQTENSCESLPEEGTLTLTDCPAPAPIVVDEEICISEAIPALTAIAASTDIRWYNSTSLIFNGASYTPTITTAGTYNFWVSQYDLVNNCEGPKAKVSIVVNDLPIVSIDNLPASMCFDDVSITLQGSPLGGIYKLSDNTEITEVNPSILGSGNHAITYTYTDANTCINSITENIQVNFTPTPIVQDTTIILYQMYDYLYAQGSGVINWFLPATTNVGTGNLFEHNQTTVGQWTYSLNQVILGCTSETVTKKLTIIDCGTPTPTVSPTLVDICDYDPMPTFSFGNIDPQVIQVQVFDSINSVVSSISAGNPYQFTPSVLSAGTYTWTVVQDTGCVSSPASFTLRIHEKPTVSITSPSSICIDANPIEIVVSPVGGVLTGTGVTGITFNPSVGEGLYTLNYVYTDSFNCSDNTATGIAVNYTPPPVGQDVISLTVFLTPNLVASGNQIKWYTEEETSNLVFSGNVFPTGITGETDTTFYITQTLNGCVSDPSPVRMVLSNCPTPAPVSNGFTKCIYEQIPNLIALGDTIAWYSSALGGAPIFEGDTLLHGIVAAGTYSYFVTQKNICESPRTKVTFTIVPQPTVSISSTSDVCRFASSVNLTMVPAGGIVSGVGIVSNAFVPDLIPGIYTQTYIYTNVQGCSDTATNSIEIHETQPPLANNLTTFTYNLDPDMDAVGTNVKWYNSASLQPLLYSGTIFPHNHTQDIITDYYVTQTENSCESAPTKVRLQILSCGTPKPDVSPDVDICNYESIPPFQAAGLPGATIHWFKSSNPSLEIYEGATFVPNEILPGTYEYYVMQDTGCRGEASIVTLRIHQTTSPTVLPTQNICEFKPNPTMRVMYTADSVLWYNQNPGYPASISPIHRGLQFQSSEIVPGDYTYYVVKKSNNCYSNPVQTSYMIFRKPTTPIVEDLSSCENESIQTFVTQDFLTGSVKWLDSYKRIVKEDAFEYTPSLSLLRLNRSVQFSAYITENGCVSDTTNFDYLYIPRPIEPIVSNPYICEGSTILPISAVGTNVNWYAEDALTLLAENSSTYTPQITSETGVYKYWITQTINTCRSLKRRVTFTVVPIPHPIIIGDSTVCEGTLAVMYNVVNFKPEETYSWEVTGDNINYSVDGTMQLHSIYADWNTQGIDSVIVTATNEQNCSSTDYRTVYIASKPYPDFEWEFPGASIVTEFTNTTIQQPVSDGDSVVQIEFESTWDFGFPNNAPLVVQPWEDIDKPMQNEYLYGVYPVTLSVVNEYGCANIIDKEIFVDIQTSLYVPTALSPFNPALEVRYFEPKGYNIKLFEIWIFDSWGNLVWYDTWNCDTDEGTPLTRWDGTYNSEVLKSDTYIWKIETTFKDGRAWEGLPTIRGFEKFGSIVLLR